MNFRIILKLLGALNFFVALSMLIPLAVSLIYRDGDAVAFGYSIATALAFSALLYVPFRKEQKPLSHLEGFAVVTLTWASICLVGSFPYLFTDAFPTVTDAIFESVSGFTTTGSTVSTDVEAMPHGILFWRSLSQWLGGMGVVVLSVAVLPLLGVGGMQLYRAEAPGPTPDRITPRIADTAKALWKVYALLTAVECALLLLAGMAPYDAVCHSLTTMSTGGFGTKNMSIESFNSPLVEWIIIVFMFAGGINFALHYRALSGNLKSYQHDREFRAYALIGATAALGCAGGLWLLWDKDVAALDALRLGLFQVLSILTTTGYSSDNFELWPSFPIYVLLILMFVGGSAGSTSGGVKTIRIVLLLKQGYRELVRLVHPNVVRPVRVGRQVVKPEITDAVWGFFFLYMFLFAMASTAMALMGLDIVTSFTAAASAIGNIGPGFGDVGPLDNFAGIPTPGKWVLMACMILGRLEIFTVIILFVPAYWRR